MNFTKNQIIIVGGFAFVAILFALMLTGVIPGLKKSPQTATKADLVIWGFEPKKAIDPAIAAVGSRYSGLKFSYRQFTDEAEYHAALLESLAAGEGPDIFVVKNSGLLQHENKITPLPVDALPLVQLRGIFPQAIERSFVQGGKIYALPVSVDTLALIFNRDLFNQAGVTTPPATWDEFTALVPKLAKIDVSRQITQAASAIGGSGANIPHASDLLSLLMLQNGTPMVNSSLSAARFTTQEGEEALAFYTQFTNVGSSVYTWNSALPNAFDLFTQGKVGMLFEYSDVLDTIRQRNPLMNFDIAPVPQKASTTQIITYANFWGYTVARQSQNPNLAWEFILSLTTDANVARASVTATGKIPALTVLLNRYFADPRLNVFARQFLVARSWPEIDPAAVDEIFSTMITLVSENRASVEGALKQGEAGVSALMAKRL